MVLDVIYYIILSVLYYQMGLEVDANIFKWLQIFNILKEGRRTPDNKIELSEQTSMKFYDGVYVGKIIKEIINQQPDAHSFEKLDAIKENSTPAIRLYNWNILCEMLKKLGLSVQYAEKSKILNMEPTPVLKVLQFLFKKQENQTKDLPKEEQNPLKVDINQVHKKQLKNAQNILEFFVISISKNFKLSPQHTLNLFLDNNKYLAHLLVKGVKNSFEPIFGLLADISNYIQQIVVTLFCVDQKQSAYFFLNAIKPALISKQALVAQNCIQVLTLLHQTYVLKSMPLDVVCSWIKQQGLNTIFFSIKRYPQLFAQNIKMIYLFTEKQLYQYLEPADKSLLWDNESQKIMVLLNLLMTLQPQTLTEFYESLSFAKWMKYVSKGLKKFKQPKQICALLSLMGWLWQNFEQQFETDQNELPTLFLALLKNCSLNQNQIVFNQSMIVMFNLMQVLGNRKNNNAPLIYKIVINCFTYCGIMQRVNYIAENLKVAYQSIKNLPGGVLVEPLMKNIEKETSQELLTLCRIIIEENRVNEDELIEIIQMFTSLIFHNAKFGNIAIQYVFDLISEMNEEMVDDFIERNMKNVLAHLYSVTSSIRRKFMDLRSDYKRYGINESTNKKQVSMFIEEMQKHIILGNLVTFYRKCAQQSQQTKFAIQPMLYHTYIRIKNQLKNSQEQARLLIPLMRLTNEDDEQLQEKLKEYEDDLNPPKQQTQIQSPRKNNSINNSSLMSRSMEMATTKPISLNALRPTPTALKDIEKIKQKIQNLKAIREQKQKQKDMMQEKKQLLRSVFNEKRMIEFGIKSGQNIQYKCIYDWDTAKEEDPSRMYGVPNLKLMDLANEQEIAFVEDVDAIIKKYRKVWRFLFFKYSTFGAKNKEEIKQEQKINMAEVWKMLKQYDFNIVKKQESHAIVRMINQNMKRRNDLQNLTYLGFEEYIFQICSYGYGKNEYPHVPPGQKIRLFIKQLKDITAKNGGNIDLFENPQEVYFQQTDVIREFNRRLKGNPQYILPEGYKKVKLTELYYQYQIHPANIQGFSPAYNDVFEILDEMISQCPNLGFHLIQPLTFKEEKNVAKPCLFQNLSQKIRQHSESKGYMAPKKPMPATSQRKKRQQKSVSFKQEFHPLVNFSLGIKLGIAGTNIKYRYIADQVAYWMDDMLDSVQNGLSIVQNKAKKRVENEYLKKKRESIQKMKMEQKNYQAKWKKRAQSVRVQANEIRQRRKLTEEQMKQERRYKRILEKQKQEQEIKKKMQQYKSAKSYLEDKRKQEENKRKIESEKKMKEKQEYKKGVEQYFQKKKEWIEQKQVAVKKSKENEEKKQQQEENKRKQLMKKLHMNILKKQSTVLERIEGLKRNFEEVWLSKQIQDRFLYYEIPLKLLFDLLIKQEKSKISAVSNDEISFNALQIFAVKFKIVPFMIEKNIWTKIVKVVGRTNDNVSGVTFKAFKETLFRIAVKAKDMLNQIVNKRKELSSQKGGKSKLVSQGNDFELEQNSLDSPSKLNISFSLKKSSLTDEYLFNAEGVTPNTIDQLMKFLNLPRDKLSMDERFRQLMEEKNAKPKNILIKQLKNNFQSQKVENT